MHVVLGFAIIYSKTKLQNIPIIITSFIHLYLELYYTLEGCNELFNICM